MTWPSRAALLPQVLGNSLYRGRHFRKALRKPPNVR